MSGEFEIVREAELATTPQEVWDAVTTGTGGWLWPMEYEPWAGGEAPFGGAVTVWEPPHHLVTRVEGENGWFNQLENVIEARDGGTTFVRYVHSGVFTDDWDNQYDGANQHTDFYLHTLSQYLQHFSHRPVAWFSADAPPASNAPDGFARLRAALGLAATSAVDDRVRLDINGVGDVDGVIDYLTPHFVGIRTSDAMYRFFGRNAFGAQVGIAMHLFGDGSGASDAADDTDPQQAEKAWRSWLDAVYA